MKLIRVGVDLAKNVFQVHGVDRSEKPVWRKKLSRADWITALVERIEPGCEIGMEACGSAHHWARQLQQPGYTVKLIAPQFVKPYVKSNKNDANDAKANQIRGLSSEYGLTAPRELLQLRAAIPCWLEDLTNGLSLRFRRLLTGLWQDLLGLDERIKELDREIALVAATDPVARRLQQLRGVGPIIATAIVANVGDARQFANGRQTAASLGLTPRQNSSGDRERLLGISKRGDAYLRILLIHGARSMMRIASTRHQNIAAVALANKTARIAWAMITQGSDYQPDMVAA